MENTFAPRSKNKALPGGDNHFKFTLSGVLFVFGTLRNKGANLLIGKILVGMGFFGMLNALLDQFVVCRSL